MRTPAIAFALLLSASASAQFDAPHNPNSSARAVPEQERLYRLDVSDQSSWYNPATSGSGWYFDRVSPGPGVDIVSGIGFIYQRDGRQAFVLGNAPRPTLNSSAARMWSNAPVMTIDLSLVETRGGACPSCDYRRPETGPGEFNRARVEWTAPTVARLRVNDSDLPPLIASDVALAGGLANRISGRHYASSISRSQFASGFPLIRNECLIDFAEVRKPFSQDALNYTSSSLMHDQPPANARWFRASFACSGDALPAETTQLTPSGYHIAVSTDLATPYAMQFTLASTNAVLDSTGNVLTYTIDSRDHIGRIYATGANAHYWPQREVQDSTIVFREYLMRRTR